MTITPWFPQEVGTAVLLAFGLPIDTPKSMAQADWVYRTVNVSFGRWVTDHVMTAFDSSETSAELLSRLQPLSRTDGLVSIRAIVQAIGTDTSASATLADIVDGHAYSGARLLASLAEADISTKVARGVALDWGMWPDQKVAEPLPEAALIAVQRTLEEGRSIRHELLKTFQPQDQADPELGSEALDRAALLEMLRRAKPVVDSALRLPSEDRPAGLMKLIQDMDRIISNG